MDTDLSRANRDDLARRHIETAEAWLRRVIEDRLSQAYGAEYASHAEALPRRTRDYIQSQISANPGRFNRSIDATSFDQAIEVIISPERYRKHFEPLLRHAYPNGREVAKTYLERIRDIRNDVSHGRGVSSRKLEQAICYCNDLVDSIKTYYRGLGLSQEYDVPLIVRYVDNIGNESHLEGLSASIHQRMIDFRKTGRGDLRPGDLLIAEVEVDSSFDRAEYKVTSRVGYELGQPGLIRQIEISNEHVAEQFELRFEVKTDREWHRQSGLDDAILLIYRVLPPIN